MNFKQGDRVRVLHLRDWDFYPEHMYATIGEVGTVVRVEDDIQVEFSPGKFWYYHREDLAFADGSHPLIFNGVIIINEPDV